LVIVMYVLGVTSLAVVAALAVVVTSSAGWEVAFVNEACTVVDEAFAVVA